MPITEPPYSEWPTLLERNKEVGRILHDTLGARLVQDQRAELLAAARAYTEEIVTIASSVGILLPKNESSGSIDSIVMAGHQPVIYHPGLLYKATKLHELAQQTQSLALSIVIDTDEGDGGRLAWPLLRDGSLLVRHATIAEGGSLYRDQTVRSVEAVRAVFADIVKDLSESGLAGVVARVERVSGLYQSLAGVSIGVANSIVRAALQERVILEVPLSKLCSLPVFKGRILRIVHDGKRFVSLYNEALKRYRHEHGIKNPANPFPSMAVDDGQLELPLWRLEAGVRKQVFVKQDDDFSAFAGALLVPRGSMVTFLLRSVCADIFIHGLGGGKYDRFVDVFATAYFGQALPSFVVASETRHLFPSEVARFRLAREVKALYKELVSRTETFFGSTLFSADDEAALRPLAARRLHLVEALKTVASDDDRRPIALSLNELNREIKACIDHSSLASTLVDGGIDDATLGRWEYREYPFFFFEA